MMLMAAMAVGEPAGDEIDRAMAVLRSADDARLTMDVRDETLSQVIAEMSAQLPVPVRADWKALERLGVRGDSEVSLRLSGASGLTALGSLAVGLGDEFERPVFETDGVAMVLTSVNGAATMRVTGVYDVRDLLANSMLVNHLRETAPVTTPSAGDGEKGDVEPEEQPAQGDSQAKGAAGRNLTPGEQFVLLITDHIDPEAWINFGGDRGRITERDGLIVLSAPPMVHWRFRSALERLRASDPKSLAVDAVILELPRATFERLTKMHGAATPGLAGAVRGDAEAAVLWRSGDPVMVGKSLQLESTNEGTTVRVSMQPEWNEEKGTMSVSVDASVESPGDSRAVKTTAAMSGDAAAMAIELPASGTTPTVRVMVVGLRRR